MSRIAPKLNKASIKSKSTPQPAHLKWARYVSFFVIGYVLASALFMLMQTQYPLNPQLVTLLSIMVGAYIAVYKFTKHWRRKLTAQESNQLALYSVIAVWILTALYFLGLWLWLFDTANRQVLVEMSRQQSFALVSALTIIIVLTLVSARFSIWIFNRLLDPN